VYVNQRWIANGQIAPQGSVPWNAGIYRLSESDSDYELICGGSIISSNLVISGKIFVKRICERIINKIRIIIAGRCFWDRSESSDRIIKDDGKYKIAVGKYDRNISIIDNAYTQIMNVSY